MVAKNLNDEIKLLIQLKSGDEVAFEVIFHRYKKKLKGYLSSTLPPHIDSEEVIQLVFIKIWKNRDRIDENKSFSSFLYKVSRNVLIDQIRMAVNRRISFLGNLQQEKANITDQDDHYQRDIEVKLNNILDRLPERRRQIFSLSRFEGLTYKQIASKLNISENTVDTQIRKSIQFLKKEVQNRQNIL